MNLPLNPKIELLMRILLDIRLHGKHTLSYCLIFFGKKDKSHKMNSEIEFEIKKVIAKGILGCVSRVDLGE